MNLSPRVFQSSDESWYPKWKVGDHQVHALLTTGVTHAVGNTQLGGRNTLLDFRFHCAYDRGFVGMHLQAPCTISLTATDELKDFDWNRPTSFHPHPRVQLSL
jgi:hypothetical protein